MLSVMLVIYVSAKLPFLSARKLRTSMEPLAGVWAPKGRMCGLRFLGLPVPVLSGFFLPMRMCVLVAQSCQTVCGPMDYSPPGSSVHGILQARILEWVAVSFSRGSSQPRD